MRTFLLIVAATSLTAVAPAYGQGGPPSGDLQYCAALSQLYMRYVGNPETEPHGIRRNDAEAENAMAQCRRGNAAAAVPVLERKLTDNRITLPSR